MFELGLSDLQGISCVLPRYVYITPPYKGIVEHEFCPIYVAFVHDDPAPNADEVEAYEWKIWPEYVQMLTDEAGKMSWWCKDQYRHIKHIAPFVAMEAK